MTPTATETEREAAIRTGAVDADTHCWHPLERWRSFIAPEHESAIVAYELEANPLGKGTIDPAVEAKIRERQAIPASDDPIERLKWMDREGIYANVIYPGAAWFSFAPDPEIAVAGCRALNRWAADFADADRDRLKPAMLLPVLHPELAVAEFRHAHDELGLDVIFAAPTPHRDRRWSDPAFDPLWSAVQAADATMTFHEFTRVDGDIMPLVARPAYRDSYPISYLCGHTVEAQLVLTDLIGGGALDRFPELKVGLIEAHVAWIPGWLALMDSLWPRISSRYASTEGTGTLELRPTEYFRRQCFVAAFPDDAWITEMADYVSADSILLSSDFPHPNATDRTPLTQVFEDHNPTLSAEARTKIIRDNGRRIFNLP